MIQQRYNNDTGMAECAKPGYAILHANWHGMATLLHIGLKSPTRPARPQGARAVFNRFAHSAVPGISVWRLGGMGSVRSGVSHRIGLLGWIGLFGWIGVFGWTGLFGYFL